MNSLVIVYIFRDRQTDATEFSISSVKSIRNVSFTRVRFNVCICITPIYFLCIMDFQYAAYKSFVVQSLTIHKIKILSTYSNRIQIVSLDPLTCSVLERWLLTRGSWHLHQTETDISITAKMSQLIKISSSEWDEEASRGNGQKSLASIVFSLFNFKQ